MPPQLVTLVWALIGMFLAVLAFRWWVGRGRIPGAEARRLVERGARLVDVRTPAEFAGGHVEGAINVPLQELATRLTDVGPPGDAVVVYCQSGLRSKMAATLLRRAGFTAVSDLGPRSAWTR